MIALRRATQADVPAVTSLARVAYTPWIEVIGREPGPMLFDYARWIESTIIDLHEVDTGLAALIQMRADEEHLTVVNVAVAPDFQGMGLGRALMAHAETLARAHGLGELRLFTNKVMTSNLRLYEKLGYTFDREEPFRGGVIVHMSKRI